MADIQSELDALADSLITQLSDPNFTGQARADALAAFAAIKDTAFLNALNNFRAGTAKFIETSTKLAAAAGNIANAALRKKIDKIVTEFGELQATFSEGEAQKAPEEGEDGPVVKEDEAVTPPPDEPSPPVEPDPAPQGGGSSTGTGTGTGAGNTNPPPKPVDPVINPKTSKSTKFSELEDEYRKFYVGAVFRSDNARDEAMRLARAAAQNRDKYEAAVDGLGIPWWFIAAAHILESGANFTRHMHNGDSLKKRTVQVPAGRPKTGNPPFTWNESARDAMKFQKFDGLKDWSIARALYRWEEYNGFGYRPKKIPSPYLWSLSKVYEKGKYIRDKVFDANAVSKQCGTVPFLKALIELGEIEPFVIGGVDGNLGESAESGAVDTKPVADGTKPNVDGTVPKNDSFEAFFAANLPGVRHFEWHEFLVKGSSHFGSGKAAGLNTDPPKKLWPNVVKLVRAIDQFREEYGAKVVLTSVYRSPKYNAAIDGSATRSQHMEFRAADMSVPGKGNPKEWAKKLREMRAAGVFTGGIGTYKTFVHIDVRGSNADWKGKGVT